LVGSGRKKKRNEEGCQLYPKIRIEEKTGIGRQRTGRRSSESSRNVGHVGDDGLDAISLALDLGVEEGHLVSVEFVLYRSKQIRKSQLVSKEDRTDKKQACNSLTEEAKRTSTSRRMLTVAMLGR
jgi:hypothetical protein